MKDLMDQDDHTIEAVLLQMTDLNDIYGLCSTNKRLAAICARAHVKRHITQLWRLTYPPPSQQLLDVVNMLIGTAPPACRTFANEGKFWSACLRDDELRQALWNALFSEPMPEQSTRTNRRIVRAIRALFEPLARTILITDAFHPFDFEPNAVMKARVQPEMLVVMHGMSELINDIEHLLHYYPYPSRIDHVGYRHELPVLKVTRLS